MPTKEINGSAMITLRVLPSRYADLLLPFCAHSWLWWLFLTLLLLLLIKFLAHTSHKQAQGGVQHLKIHYLNQKKLKDGGNDNSTVIMRFEKPSIPELVPWG